MGFETAHLVRIVELEIETTGPLTLNVYSDLPGNAIALRESRTVDTSGTSGRRTVRFRLAGTTKGKLFQWELTGAALCRLYGGRVFAKPMGNAGDWAWFALPIEATPEDWQAVPLPIEPTPEDWQAVPLPIEATAEDWQAVPLPIEPTPEDWNAIALPIPETPDAQQWADIPVAA